MSSKVPENVTITQKTQSTEIGLENRSVDIVKDKRKCLKCLLTTAALCTVLNPFIGIFVLYNYAHRRAVAYCKLQNRRAEKAYRKLSYFLGAFGVLFSGVLFWGMIAFIIIHINTSQQPLPVPSQRPRPKIINFDQDAKELSNILAKSHFFAISNDKKDHFRTASINVLKNTRGNTGSPKFLISKLKKSKSASTSVPKVNETDVTNMGRKTNYTM